jgi:hypothetical protein
MTRWIVAVTVALLMLCEMVFSVSTVFAGAFDQLSPGNQKAVRALFEAQRSDPPPGTRRLTLDEIAARKQNGQGWGRIFDDMKSRGLVAEKNFGQAISSFNHRHHISSASTVTTGANRTVSIGRGSGVRTSHSDSSSGHVSNSRQDATTMSMQARAQTGGANGVGHGRGK